MADDAGSVLNHEWVNEWVVVNHEWVNEGGGIEPRMDTNGHELGSEFDLQMGWNEGVNGTGNGFE
jgi:hypothetical protein